MAPSGPRGSRPDEQLPAVAPAGAVPGTGPVEGAAPSAGGVPTGSPAGAAGAAERGGPVGGQPGLSPAEVRALKFTARNMVWSLLPLTVLILVMVWWTQLRQPDDPVHPVEIDSSLFLAAQHAGYPLLVPQDLGPGWQPTSVRTDAGAAQSPSDPVTLQIGWYTPGQEYAGYVISDDAGAGALTDVLDDAKPVGTVQAGGTAWQRLTTQRGETALTRTQGTATLLVTGSASEQELETLAGAVRPYRAP